MHGDGFLETDLRPYRKMLWYGTRDLGGESDGMADNERPAYRVRDGALD